MTDDDRRDDPDPVPSTGEVPAGAVPEPGAASLPDAESAPAPPAPPAVQVPVEWLPPKATVAAPGERPRTQVQRIAEAFVWALGIAAVLFLGRFFVLFNPAFGLTGFEQGEIVGRIAGALFIGLVVRWGWVKLRRRGRLLSPWILVIAALALASQLTRTAAISVPPVGQPSPSAAAPVDTYLQVGTPYTLASASADVTEQFSAAFERSSSATEVREIREAGVAVGYLVVANARTTTSDDFFAGFETGFEENEGAEAHLETVSGTEVLVGTGPQFAAIVWKEPPYAVVVYALDAESGKALAASVMAAYR